MNFGRNLEMFFWMNPCREILGGIYEKNVISEENPHENF